MKHLNYVDHLPLNVRSTSGMPLMVTNRACFRHVQITNAEMDRQSWSDMPKCAVRTATYLHLTRNRVVWHAHVAWKTHFV